MNSLYRIKPTTLLALVVLLAICVTSCATGREAYTRGTQAAISKDFEAAMTEFKMAVDKQPGNAEYQLKYAQAVGVGAFVARCFGRHRSDASHRPQ